MALAPGVRPALFLVSDADTIAQYSVIGEASRFFARMVRDRRGSGADLAALEDHDDGGHSKLVDEGRLVRRLQLQHPLSV